MSARFPDLDGAGDEEEDRSGVSFELVRVAWRRKLLICLIVILTVLVAILVSTRQTKQYESSASLLFRDPDENLINLFTPSPPRRRRVNDAGREPEQVATQRHPRHPVVLLTAA